MAARIRAFRAPASAQNSGGDALTTFESENAITQGPVVIESLSGESNPFDEFATEGPAQPKPSIFKITPARFSPRVEQAVAPQEPSPRKSPRPVRAPARDPHAAPDKAAYDRGVRQVYTFAIVTLVAAAALVGRGWVKTDRTPAAAAPTASRVSAPRAFTHVDVPPAHRSNGPVLNPVASRDLGSSPAPRTAPRAAPAPSAPGTSTTPKGSRRAMVDAATHDSKTVGRGAVPPSVVRAAPPPPDAAFTPNAQPVRALDVGRVAMTPSPAVPAAASAAPPLAPERTDTSAIQQVLNRYREAFNALDPYEVERAWPSVDSRKLARAFDQLSEQRFQFHDCNVVPTNVHAVAVCRGTAAYVPKIGSKTAHVEPRTWTFALSKMNDAWWIDSVQAR